MSSTGDRVLKIKRKKKPLLSQKMYSRGEAKNKTEYALRRKKDKTQIGSVRAFPIFRQESPDQEAVMWIRLKLGEGKKQNQKHVDI